VTPNGLNFGSVALSGPEKVMDEMVGNGDRRADREKVV
jgi:hypothetical protein